MAAPSPNFSYSRQRALKIPPAVIERLGVGLDELELLHDVLTRVNAAALAAGALDGKGCPVMNRPGLMRYVAYSFGGKLPDDMGDWVRNDLTGDHAVVRHLVRSMVAFLPVFAAGLLVPSALALRSACVLLAVILGLIYSFAFMDMNRRRRLSQHGFPEDLENQSATVPGEPTRGCNGTPASAPDVGP